MSDKSSRSQSKKRRKRKQKQFATSYINANVTNFNPDQIYLLKEKLNNMSTRKQTAIQSIPIKNPTLALVLSIFFGTLGIDRFYIGDIGLGIGKLLTLGGFGIWALIDWFMIMKATRKKNYQKVMTAI